METLGTYSRDQYYLTENWLLTFAFLDFVLKVGSFFHWLH